LDLLNAAILGIIQGLTEFLPVSSSGHLILARACFGWDPGRFGVPFDVACHAGTLIAVLAYFRRDVWQLVAATPGALAGRTGQWHHLVRLIAVGTIPIVIVGARYADAIETSLRTPAVVAAMLVVGGMGLIVADRLGSGDRTVNRLGYGQALVIGMAQAAALAPGISRSGATITAAMLLGLERAAAARFIFLMSLPAILAAMSKEIVELRGFGLAAMPVSIFAAGFLAWALVGYLTVKYLMRFLSTHSLSGFAYYRFALAAVTIVWLAAR
jgi:undecaprenyl-diphosphatase